MNKDFKVLWTELAIADLLSIKEYISEDSPELPQEVLQLLLFQYLKENL